MHSAGTHTPVCAARVVPSWRRVPAGAGSTEPARRGHVAQHCLFPCPLPPLPPPPTPPPLSPGAERPVRLWTLQSCAAGGPWKQREDGHGETRPRGERFAQTTDRMHALLQLHTIPCSVGAPPLHRRQPNADRSHAAHHTTRTLHPHASALSRHTLSGSVAVQCGSTPRAPPTHTRAGGLPAPRSGA